MRSLQFLRVAFVCCQAHTRDTLKYASKSSGHHLSGALKILRSWFLDLFGPGWLEPTSPKVRMGDNKDKGNFCFHILRSLPEGMFLCGVRRALPAAGQVLSKLQNVRLKRSKCPRNTFRTSLCTAQMPSDKTTITIQCIQNWPSWFKRKSKAPDDTQHLSLEAGSVSVLRPILLYLVPNSTRHRALVEAYGGAGGKCRAKRPR